MTPEAVTLFGVGDAIDVAVSDALAGGGGRTHLVTVPSGWIGSADPVVLRLETPAGERALRSLVEHDGHGERVVALCRRSTPASSATGVRAIARTCSGSHDFTLAWHDGATDPEEIDRLARAVVEQVRSRTHSHFDEVALPG